MRHLIAVFLFFPGTIQCTAEPIADGTSSEVFECNRWQIETLDCLKKGQPVKGVDRAIEELGKSDRLQNQVEIIRSLQNILINAPEPEYPSEPYSTEDQVSEFYLAREFIALLDFQTAGDRVTNADLLRHRILHGVAPRTDIPTVDDILPVEAALQALQILEIVSGEADPILVAGRHRPHELPPAEEPLQLSVGDSFDIWYPDGAPEGLTRYVPVTLNPDVVSLRLEPASRYSSEAYIATALAPGRTEIRFVPTQLAFPATLTDIPATKRENRLKLLRDQTPDLVANATYPERRLEISVKYSHDKGALGPIQVEVIDYEHD